jgi:ketosteroid isomerase-like protein
MSLENVEIVRVGIAAFNRRDTEALMAVLHPDIEWVSGMPGTSSYRGREGVRKMLREVETAWKDMHLAPMELLDHGEAVIANCKVTAEGRSSGVRVEGNQVGVIDFSDGLFARVRIFMSRNEALEGARLRE